MPSSFFSVVIVRCHIVSVLVRGFCKLFDKALDCAKASFNKLRTGVGVWSR